MKKKVFIVPVILVSLLFVTAGIFIRQRRLQAADLPPVNAEPTIIYLHGHVISKATGKPLNGILISIGTMGKHSNQYGEYCFVFPVNQTTIYQTVPITFEDPATNKTYQLADTYEQSITLVPGSTTEDFTVE